MAVMQIVRYVTARGPGVGALIDGRVRPLTGYATSETLLADWAAFEQRLRGASMAFAAEALIPEPQLLAPVVPLNIYFAGANYRDHVEEMKRKLDLALDSDPRASGVKPWHSLKAAGSTVVGPGATVVRPAGTAMLDWELELAVVIGTTAKDVGIADALECVAGYTVANDLSARDHVGRRNVADTSPFKWDWIGQKSFDGACPLGPALTPRTSVADVQDLDMKLWVNGELKQDSNTSQMIFSVAEQVAHLSSRITLHPGDVILTGTPSGVGMADGVFLKAGDVVRQWIESIGEFEFRVA